MHELEALCTRVMIVVFDALVCSEDCLKVGTNFYECMEWQDNNKKNSVLEYVVGFLAQNKTEGQGIDIKELEALQTTLTKCLKQKMWNLVSVVALNGNHLALRFFSGERGRCN